MPQPTQKRQIWKSHPTAGLIVRLAALVAPIALSVLATAAASRVVARPHSFGAVVAWWIGLTGFATLVAVASERLARRLLPLAALLKLTLVFPDTAPRRYGLALRTGTTRQLQRRIEAARSDGLGDTPQAVAEHVLELVAALNVHDRLTRGHCERVRAYVDLLAQEMHLDREDASRLHWVGMIHDIGKIEVPAAILNKPGVPTDEEWELIRRHPAAGARLAAPLADWVGPWIGGVADHHERWDGTGYPRGLEGDGISLGGRMVAVADAFDVITAARSYKAPRSAREAREELARCAGTQFDPDVVRAFLNISLGRLRVVIGPMSWLAQVPVLGRVPLAPAAGAVTSSLAAVVALTLGGLVDQRQADADPVVEAAAGADLVAESQTEEASRAGEAADGRTPESDDSDSSAGGAEDLDSLPSQAGDEAGGSGEPGPTTGGPSQPTATTPPVAPPSGGATTRLWLEGAPADGDTTSAAVLPLTASVPGDSGQPNYDTDRDAAVGLLVNRSGDGLAETDPSKRQQWARPLTSAMTLAGPAALDLYVAVKNMETTKTGEVFAMIQDCSATQTDCIVLGTGSVTFSQASFGDAFGSVRIDFGTIYSTIAAGRMLVLTAVTGDGPADSDDLWYAFGSTTYASNLTLST